MVHADQRIAVTIWPTLRLGWGPTGLNSELRQMGAAPSPLPGVRDVPLGQAPKWIQNALGGASAMDRVVLLVIGALVVVALLFAGRKAGEEREPIQVAVTTEEVPGKGWIARAVGVRATAQGATQAEARENLLELLREYPELLEEREDQPELVSV